MTTARFVAAISGAMLLTGVSAIAAPYDPYEEPTNCGFVNRSGTIAYLGACPGPENDTPDTPAGPSAPDPEPGPAE